MYCPQCGKESSADLRYCRSCGANLRVIGKAVSLSEAIARSDRGPLPRIKEMMKSLRVEQVTDDISRALEQMNNEIVSSADDSETSNFWGFGRRKKSAAERREKHITGGVISLFTGAGLTVFLYYLAAVLVLKLPPDVVAKVPFEIAPVVQVLWLLGLIPMLSGLGHIIAGLLIHPESKQIASAANTPMEDEVSPPQSVTEHTTNFLTR